MTRVQITLLRIINRNETISGIRLRRIRNIFQQIEAHRNYTFTIDHRTGAGVAKSHTGDVAVITKQIHNMNIESLWALNTGSVPKPSVYSKNGCDTERIRKILMECACSCKKNCSSRFTFKRLLEICKAFWMLDKKHQDKAVWCAACAGEWDSGDGGASDSDSDDECSNSSSEHTTLERRSRRQWRLSGLL